MTPKYHPIMIFIMFLLLTFASCSFSQNNDWTTFCEQSGFKRTPRYAETHRYFQRLDKTSPYVKMKAFGKTGENRKLQVVIISKDQAFTPEKAIQTGKPVILIANCIHPGESAGKDAGMMFVRDLIITKKYPHILEQAILLIIPILNPDGHERFGPYNRINQIGPDEMGWRVNATRLNLNRDFMKAETPEIRAWLNLYNQWLPHLFIDCHTTDGSDFQYSMLYYIDTHPEFGGAVSQWTKDYFEPELIARCEQQGYYIGLYAGLIDEKHPEKGMRGGVWTPRLSNAYATLRNRAGLLLEAHSLKDYKARVLGSYAFLVAAIEAVIARPELLIQAINTGDLSCQKFGTAQNPRQNFPLSFDLTEQADSILYRGYPMEMQRGTISGADYRVYHQIPQNTPTVIFDYVIPKVSVPLPIGYLIPQQWTQIIDIVSAHGIRMFTLAETVRDTFELYRFEDQKWASQTYEGHHRLSFRAVMTPAERAFSAGTIYIPLAQTNAKVILHLLEPDAPDALIRWGYFNTIFEQKEYFERYTMEPYAQKMIKDNPQLKIEFEEKLKSDANFAANSYERLLFFYQRSPYWDEEQYLYPVARVISSLKSKLIEYQR